MQLSFIVPVYNTSAYLDKCLESIFDQGFSLSDFEVIIVNDGSTDESCSVIAKWEEKHQNIVVVTQANQGLSLARNVGITKSSGKYIQFVDSDDWLVSNTISYLLDRCNKHNLDILSFDLQRVNELGDKKHILKSVAFVGQIFSGLELMRRANILAPVCKYLIKRDFIIDSNIRFYPHIYHEDEEFTPRLFLAAKRVMLTNIVAYNHFVRSNSITQDKANNYRSLEDKIKVAFMLYAYSENTEFTDDQKQAIRNRNSQLVVDIFVSIARLEKWKQFFDRFKLMLTEKEVIYHKSENLSYKSKAILFLTNWGISFYFLVLYSRYLSKD